MKGLSVDCLLLLFITTFLLTSDAISTSSTLRPTGKNVSWVSSSGIFSAGFLPSEQSPASYIFSIAFFGTPIWLPTRSLADPAASVQFTSTGNIRLLNGSGSLLWQSDTANMGITTAELDDFGNLVLKNASSFPMWQSFEHPTDTVIQNQSLSNLMVLRSGNYSFALTTSGNLTLTWNNNITYWNQGLNSSINQNQTLSYPSLMLQSDGILYLYDITLPSGVKLAYTSDYGDTNDAVRFLRLDSDGNLRAYSAARGSTSPTILWSAVPDQCEVFGRCGSFGICTYNDSDPICECPSQNFEFLNPDDHTKGCKRKMELEDCRGNSTMLELDHTKFLTYPPEISSDSYYAGITACRSNCLIGPCIASTALADGTGVCYLKTSSFVSGYKSPSIPSTSFVVVCSPAIANESPTDAGKTNTSSPKLSAGIVAIVVVGTLLSLAVLEVSLWCWFCRNNAKFGGLSAKYALLDYVSGAPVQFTYRDLRRATHGFKDRLGAGGFGAVYRGILADRTAVAVKKLEGIEQGEKQFRMEVATISSTHHLNLVRLIGFCSEGRHRLLVYEYLKNGSLDNLLFSEGMSGKGLQWDIRFNIALGTARGLTYLHEECRDCVVHCDIKPENILLDDNYTAKVSDFGLAKLISQKDHRHRTLTSVRGTRGYLAPEWIANLPITSKSDVYSYGMVLLEIISGRRNFEVSNETKNMKFSVWAYDEFDKGNPRSILDPRFVDQDVDLGQLVRLIQVSFWCIQDQPSQRPTMGKVVQMLEGISVIEKPPVPKPKEGSFSSDSCLSLSSNPAASAPVISSGSSLRNYERASSFCGTSVKSYREFRSL